MVDGGIHSPPTGPLGASPAVARFAGRVRGWLKRARGAFKGRRPAIAPSPVSQRPYPWEALYPEGLDWDLQIEAKPVHAILDDAVARFGDQPCLDFLGKRQTYKEVGALVDRAAQGFRDIGVRKGTKVGLFLPNSPYYVISYFAVLKAGGTIVNFNPLYAKREVARQIRDAGVQIMVTMNLVSLYPRVAVHLEDTALERVVVCKMSSALPLPEKALFTIFKRKEIASVPSDIKHCRFEQLIDNEGLQKPVPCDPYQDVAVLQYTGGTTGIPKGAMLTHASIYSNTVQTRRWATQLEDGEARILAILPLFHVFGMTVVMNVSLYCGAEIILHPRFKVSEVLTAIEKRKVTVMFGVPTMYSAINAHKEVEKFDLSSLRFCISGGAALPDEVRTAFEDLSGGNLVEGYGLTEASPVCTIGPIGGRNKPGSAGLPIPGTLLEILPLEGEGGPLPAGQHGEICITGPQVMTGYAKQEAETAGVLRNGRLHTGDIGYLDGEGYLFIVDRIKDLIITGGFNVYPRMVEEAVSLHPDVMDVAVCGVPNKHRGETVKAFIVKRADSDLTGVKLRDFLKEKLAPFEIPRKVTFLDEIPKTMLGKPLRRELLALEKHKARKSRTGAEESPKEEIATAEEAKS